MPRAIWNGKVVAESDNTVMVEGNHYFPIDSINQEYLQESSHRTLCPWKGMPSYYDVVINEERNPDAA